jgi:hypothetical protein
MKRSALAKEKSTSLQVKFELYSLRARTFFWSLSGDSKAMRRYHIIGGIVPSMVGYPLGAASDG